METRVIRNMQDSAILLAREVNYSTKFCSCCNLSDASTRSILGKRTLERKALIIPS